MIWGVASSVIEIPTKENSSRPRPHQSEDRLHGGRLAAGIAAKQADNLATAHFQGQSEVDLDWAVEGVDSLKLQDRLRRGGFGCAHHAKRHAPPP
jgi:hypothetical protein